MIRRPPRSTRTDTLFPYTTLFRSHHQDVAGVTFNGKLAGENVLVTLVVGQAGKDRNIGRQRLNPHAGKFAFTNAVRSEEHTSELQSLMRISYAVFCLKKKIIQHISQIR